MQFYRDSSSIPPSSARTVLTIGNFDGVHQGHQMIIAEVVERARHLGAIPTLMTFDPPPARVLGRAPHPQIMTLEDKRETVADLGIELFVCETFNLALASTAPLAFMQDILENRLNPREILVGYDFCFGKQRKGNVEVLRQYFQPRGCRVEQFGALTIPLIRNGDSSTIVSSTKIRSLLLEGDVTQASHLLGRPHFLWGPVVHGDARGRQLGFPTANVRNEENLLPAHGVYVVLARVGERTYPAVANIGSRPTFRGDVVRLEVHLLDYQGDLYGHNLRVEFIQRLRGEQKFPSVEALEAQIRKDVAAARQVLAGHSFREAPSRELNHSMSN